MSKMWSVWKDGQHIGWAVGDANTAALKSVLGSSFRFRYEPGTAVPTRWAKQWLPVYKDHTRRVLWGAFLDGWNHWITWQLQKAYGYATHTVEGNFKRAS